MQDAIFTKALPIIRPPSPFIGTQILNNNFRKIEDFLCKCLGGRGKTSLPMKLTNIIIIFIKNWCREFHQQQN